MNPSRVGSLGATKVVLGLVALAGEAITPESVDSALIVDVPVDGNGPSLGVRQKAGGGRTVGD